MEFDDRCPSGWAGASSTILAGLGVPAPVRAPTVELDTKSSVMRGVVVMSDTRVFYRDIKPYDAPAALTDLHGPDSGSLDLPSTV